MYSGRPGARYLRGEREDIEIEMPKATPRKKIKIV